ncbi:purine/pyrimidine permease [Nocardia yamanashiensis]|uniref:uracil-xanthine permease family protein n=1 Tax=Nocardia yamanashiensis TaxID=209247 RepID=UPI001E362FB8|nr:solute carrier family 23 protein [Nocardia yamanashiensis]UGT44939.1 purine/pyrimidine permease [Nocardia yamanashiensis]
MTAVHPVDEIPSAGRAFVAALQHLAVMIAMPITSVLLVTRSLHLDDSTARALLSATLLCSGIGTILQSIGRFGLGAGLPFIMLPGGAAVVLFLQIAQESDPATASGAVILTAVLGILLVPIARRLVTRIPAVVIASMVVVIGVNLVKVAGGLIATPGDQPPVSAVGLAAATILVTVLAHRFLPAGWRRVSVLIGMIAGTALAAAIGQFHLRPGSALVQAPTLFPFGTPHFDILAALPLIIFSIGSMAEATGQTVLNAKVVGKTIDPGPTVARTIRGDAVTSLLSGPLGGATMVTSGENIGLIQLTGIRSRYVTALAGGLLAVAAFFAPIGRLVNSLPGPVVGGTAAIAFAMIIVAGIGMFDRLDLTADGVLITATAALTAGLLPILTPTLYRSFPADLRLLLGSGVTIAAVVGVLVHLLFAARVSKSACQNPESSKEPANMGTPGE